jgi:hypothetical protein
MPGKIPWTRVLAEGAVIVVSILLAFSIDAWWEGRGESQRAEDYLTRLHADLVQDTASISYLLAGLARKNAALLSLQAATQRGVDQADFASAMLQAEQYGWGQFQFNGTTFEDLRSTGNLRLIADDELRARLVDYYEAWRLEQARIAHRRSDLPATVYRLLPIEFGVADSLTVTVDENQALDLRELGAVKADDLMDAAREPSFQRDIVHELNYTGFARTALLRLHQRALRVLILVEDAL